MPELPEVETVCRGLTRPLNGKIISRVETHRPNLRIPFPENLENRLAGVRVTDIYRRAKYVLIPVSNGETLILHLGMSGRILISGPDDHPPLQKHDHMVITTDDNIRIIFNDPRRFGMVDIALTESIENHRFFKHLGPEPLGNHFSAAHLQEKFNRKTVSVKNALLDQRIVAGLGNIYVCEALYHAGIDPRRAAGDLATDELTHLVAAIRAVLNTAIAAGGSSLKDYVQIDGNLGYFQHKFAVYGKTGKACHDCNCDVSITGGVQKIAQAGRSTFFCPRKQA